MSFTERVFFMEAQLDKIEELIEAEQEEKRRSKTNEDSEERSLSLHGIYISSSNAWGSSGSDAERGITLMAKYFQLVEILERLKAEYGY